MEKINIYKSVWLPNDWDQSESLIEDFSEMGISCITFTAEYGDPTLEIARDNDEIEKICSVLKSYHIIDKDQSNYLIDNKVDIIVLY